MTWNLSHLVITRLLTKICQTDVCFESYCTNYRNAARVNQSYLIAASNSVLIMGTMGFHEVKIYL